MQERAGALTTATPGCHCRPPPGHAAMRPKIGGCSVGLRLGLHREQREQSSGLAHFLVVLLQHAVSTMRDWLDVPTHACPAAPAP